MKGYRDISHFSFIFSDAFTIVLHSHHGIFAQPNKGISECDCFNFGRAGEVESERIDFGDQKRQKNKHATNERV